jgi:hypothetical protein
MIIPPLYSCQRILKDRRPQTAESEVILSLCAASWKYVPNLARTAQSRHRNKTIQGRCAAL